MEIQKIQLTCFQHMNKKLKLWELNRISEEEFKTESKIPIVLVLDDIRSLSNIGAFFRTADAFCVEKIIACGITACPPHREIHKTALGATETVQWSHEKSLLEAIEGLKKQGYCIISIEQTEKTVPLHKIAQINQSKFALIFGNEVHGVKQEAIDVSDFIIEIPQFGTKHSLNVSVCAGIVMWEFVKKLDKRLGNE